MAEVGSQSSPLGQWVTHTPSVLGSTPPYHQLNPGQRDGHLGGQKGRQGRGVMSEADGRSAGNGSSVAVVVTSHCPVESRQQLVSLPDKSWCIYTATHVY